MYGSARRPDNGAMNRFLPHLLLFAPALLLLAASVQAQPASSPRGAPPGHHGWPPPAHLYRREHPQHGLAWWYANESMQQAQIARDMQCGFAGERWTLDWEVHYRWALRANPRRAYERVAERERLLAGCRSRQLHNYQHLP